VKKQKKESCIYVNEGVFFSLLSLSCNEAAKVSFLLSSSGDSSLRDMKGRERER
jgi:hypothetical protein